jgi:hypothetical protein
MIRESCSETYFRVAYSVMRPTIRCCRCAGTKITGRAAVLVYFNTAATAATTLKCKHCAAHTDVQMHLSRREFDREFGYKKTKQKIHQKSIFGHKTQKSWLT